MMTIGSAMRRHVCLTMYFLRSAMNLRLTPVKAAAMTPAMMPTGASGTHAAGSVRERGTRAKGEDGLSSRPTELSH